MNTIIITEGSKTFTIRSNQEFKEEINGNARTIYVFEPENFDVTGAVESNQHHFVTTFSRASINLNGTMLHGDVTVTNRPGEHVEVRIM